MRKTYQMFLECLQSLCFLALHCIISKQTYFKLFRDSPYPSIPPANLATTTPATERKQIKRNETYTPQSRFCGSTTFATASCSKARS